MNERAEKVQVTAHMREYWPGDWPSLNDARFFMREVVSTGLSEAICTYGYQANGKWVEIPKKVQGRQMKRMSIDDLWDYLPEKWQWVAMDKNEDWYIYTDKPYRLKNLWRKEDGDGVYSTLSLDYDGPWEESLHERPKKEIGWRIEGGCVLLYAKQSIDHAWDVPAPPEVAEWFRKVMEAKE